MRYCKGSCVVTTDHDLPLIRLVRNSRFVSHAQLFELIGFEGTAPARSTFNWRIQRLLKSNHLERLDKIFWQGTWIYSITPRGLAELEGHGEFTVGLHSKTKQMPDPIQVYHSLELNAVRLSLARKTLLIDWKSDIEISSTNMVSGTPYRKDYDAIVKIWVGKEVREFALEYERSLKGVKQYQKMRSLLQSEREVNRVLYLTPNLEVMMVVLSQMTPTSFPIGFATAKLFRDQLLDTSITTGMNRPVVTLEQFLK